ncbi:hypothetical protein HPB47_015410 [Ixodes persulcatus]|uniref:Uncharacterized protein n=1 Tax=Ixodes persulcatus TaxID=34615 RepID=A0AC60QTK3_IXOPE|nr:hypothetical protein HPB47_015410 [Ixodes persulcatus]
MDSPMDYQQAYKPHGFKTWLSATIAPGRGAACPVPELRLFDDTSEHTFSDIFSPEEQRILMLVDLRLCRRQLFLEEVTLISESEYLNGLLGNYALQAFQIF